MKSPCATTRRRRPLGPVLLSALLVLACVGVIPAAAWAQTARPAGATPAPPATGSVLAIVRSGGANLYDTAGSAIAAVPAGATLDVTGRTPDGQWLYAATRDGTAGWVSPAGLLVYGVAGLPARAAFAGPQSSAEGAATPVRAASRTADSMHTPATPVAALPAANAGGTRPAGTAGVTGGATAVPAAAGRDPSHARPVPAGLQTAAVGQRLWYAFEYAGDNSQVTVDMQADPAAAATFAVWAPEDVRRWARDNKEQPTGRGAPNRLFGGDLVWTGNSREPGTYYVVVDQAGPTPASFTLKVTGSGVSTPAPAAAPGTAGPAVSLPAAVISSTDTLNVRAGPGAGYAVIDALAGGTAVHAVARDAAGAWVQISRPAGAGPAWVSAGYLALQGDLKSLPLAAPAGAAPAAAHPATWAAPGGKLAFQDHSGGSIYLYDFATGTVRHLANGADPAISRDGTQVAFWRDTGKQELQVIGADGSGEQTILTRGEQVRAPSWSPDGARLVFAHVVGQDHCRDAGYGICLPDARPYNFALPLVLRDRWGLASIGRDGQAYQDVATARNAIEPSWAERGIAYGAWGIQLTQDSTDARDNRSVLGEYRYQDPALQPGGDRIIYQSQEKDHWEIFAVNADGTNRAALTRPETALVDRLPNNVAPAWSPDGQHIAFLSDRTGKWQLWAMNADGSEQRALPIDVPIEYNYQAEQVVSWGQ